MKNKIMHNKFKSNNNNKKTLVSLVKEIYDWTKYKDSDWSKRARVALENALIEYRREKKAVE